MSGRHARIIAIVEDVEAEKRADEGLRRANEKLHDAVERLRDADQRKDEFLAMLRKQG